MPTNKTALEMLIENLKEQRIEFVWSPEHNYKNELIDRHIQLIESKLPTERTQIEEAFESGDLEAKSHPHKQYKSASDYYNKTFKDGE